MEQISVFDIFKIGVGPSSSHTMGPWVAAQLFLEKIKVKDVSAIKVKLFGSLSKTGKGHGTDIAVQLGLSGFDAKTIAVDKIEEYILEINKNEELMLNGVKLIAFDPVLDIVFNNEKLPFHPNGITFVAQFEDDSTIEETYYSIGGGFVTQEGEEIVNHDAVKFPFPIASEKDLLKHMKAQDLGVYDVVYKNELALNSAKEIDDRVNELWNAMQASIFNGCHKNGILPGGLNVIRRAFNINIDLIGDRKYSNFEEWIAAIKTRNHSFSNVTKWVSCFALAVNEENAAFGRIVTAPTNGAAGVIPAVLLYMLCFCETKEDAVKEFLLVAGEIGSLFKKGSTISAAMGGCQAEIGVSSAMAAAGLTHCMGGSSKQVLQAAEIAMEHHLGLTCDPIMGLVQVPCIERNTMGAMKAITASQIALAGNPDAAKVTLDQVIKTMKETAAAMNDQFKETSEGGLAVNISVAVPEC
ncbi:MAG: L-serine ammonia-lyase [Flavobacteriales bacterium]|tara:strand:+ start:81 stop:1484 length:1404 start_codon:yes stop_codon:yes gene_type:complete